GGGHGGGGAGGAVAGGDRHRGGAGAGGGDRGGAGPGREVREVEGVTAKGVVVKSQLVGAFVAYARARGADADRLIREHGLPSDVESRFEVELPVKALHRFCEACEAAAGDPLLGLHVAQQLRRGTYGLVEY